MSRKRAGACKTLDVATTADRLGAALNGLHRGGLALK
jgi:hypothetical protein